MKSRQIALWFSGGTIAGIVATATWIVGWDALFRGVDRWQTLLTGLLAVGAAIWASRPVFRQLDQMRRQSAASAIGPYSSIAQRLEDEAARLVSTDQAIKGCQEWLRVLRYESPDVYQHQEELRGKLFEKSRSLELEIEYYKENKNRHSRPSTINDSRTKFIGKIDAARALFEIITSDYNQITAWDDETVGPDLSPEEREAFFNKCEIELSDSYISLLMFKAALMEGIVHAWRMVRDLEDAVIDDRGTFST